MLTDKEIIQKIQYLRAIQPNQDWVNSFHQALKAEMGKIGKKPSFPALSSQMIFGKIFRPIPLFTTAGVFGVIAVFVAFGMLPGNQTNPGITGNPGAEQETALVRGGDGNDSKNQGKGFSLTADINAVKKGEVGSNARTVILGGENGQFEQELFDKVSEKLRQVEQMVGEISTVSDVRQTKELLDKAKEALSNGNLVDAFDVLVALERLLER